MDNNLLSGHTKSGTISGTFLVLMVSIRWDDLLRTAILAAIGATVSFAVSVFLKYISNKINSK